MPRHADQQPVPRRAARTESWGTTSLRAVADEAWAGVPAPGWPAGLPRARVAEVARSLDFYLALGCEVRRAADGWALLCCGQTSFVLIQATPPTDSSATSPVDLRIAASPLVRLSTPDVWALLRRLLAEGVPVSTITRRDRTPAHEIEVTDPDLHRVVIGQPGPVTATTTVGGTGHRLHPQPAAALVRPSRPSAESQAG